MTARTTNESNSAANSLRGLVEMKLPHQQTGKLFSIRIARPILGSHPECDIHLPFADLAPQHLAFSFGRSQVAVKTLATPFQVDGRTYREYLFNQPTVLSIGELRITVTPANFVTKEVKKELPPPIQHAHAPHANRPNIAPEPAPTPPIAMNPVAAPINFDDAIPKIETLIKNWIDPLQGAIESLRSNLEEIKEYTKPSYPVIEIESHLHDDITRLEGNLTQRIDSHLQLLFDEVGKLRSETQQTPVVDVATQESLQQFASDLEHARNEIQYLQQQVHVIAAERNSAQEQVESLSKQLSSTCEAFELHRQNEELGSEEQSRLDGELQRLEQELQQVQATAEEQILAWQAAHSELQQQLEHWQTEAARREQELRQLQEESQARWAQHELQAESPQVAASFPKPLPQEELLGYSPIEDSPIGFEEEWHSPSSRKPVPDSLDVFGTPEPEAAMPGQRFADEMGEGEAFAGFTREDHASGGIASPDDEQVGLSEYGYDSNRDESTEEDEVSPFLASFLKKEESTEEDDLAPKSRESNAEASRRTYESLKKSLLESRNEEAVGEEDFETSSIPSSGLDEYVGFGVAEEAIDEDSAPDEPEEETFHSRSNRILGALREASRDVESDDEGSDEEDGSQAGQSFAQDREQNTFVSRTAQPKSEENEEEDSIEAYMQRLLQRVRGNSDTVSGTPAESAAPKPVPAKSVTQKIERARLTEPAKPQPAEPKTTTDFVKETSAVETKSSTDEFVPRQAAPERNKGIAAMRELANSTARTAIEKSDRRKLAAQAFFKAAVVLIGLGGGFLLLLLNGLRPNMALVGAISGFGVAALWGPEAIQLNRNLRKLDSEGAPK